MSRVHFCINAKPEKTEKVEKFPQQAVTQKIMVQNKEKEIKILKDLLEERNKNSNLYHFSFNNHHGQNMNLLFDRLEVLELQT